MEKPIIFDKKPIILETKSGTYFWCACGKSAKQPFCDGSHKGTSFVPLKTVIEADKKVAWCACKNTKNPPFCDGSHTKL